jgi:hypothetical protein
LNNTEVVTIFVTVPKCAARAKTLIDSTIIVHM